MQPLAAAIGQHAPAGAPLWQSRTSNPDLDSGRYHHAHALDLVSHAPTGVVLLTTLGSAGPEPVSGAERDTGLAMLTLPLAPGNVVEGVMAGSRLPHQRLRPGSLAFLPEQADFRIAYPAATGWLNLIFPDGWLCDRIGSGHALAPIPHAVDAGATQLAQQIIAEAREPGPASRLLIEGLGRALAVRLARLDGIAPTADAERIHLTAARLRRVTDFVDAHLDADIGIAELAAAADLSPFHFTRVFKRATGQTPWAYVRQRRMEQARQLLAATDLPIAAIAQSCGYARLAHFTTSFTLLTGVTPSRYRREVRGLAV